MRVVKIKKFTEEVEDIGWLVDGLLPDTGWTLLVGKQGLGKSTFAMQLCNALQDHTDFLGRKTQQRDVMFIQADSATAEWRMMLKRIAPDSDGWTMVDVPAKCLDNAAYVELIKTWVPKVKPGFIVFDSLYNLTGKSISTEGVLVPIQAMKSIANASGEDIPWLLIHHPPHNETRAAGHHSIAANCSNEWHLLKSMIKIAKGRLVKDKSVLLSRLDNGLWTARGDAPSNGKYQGLDIGL